MEITVLSSSTLYLMSRDQPKRIHRAKRQILYVYAKDISHDLIKHMYKCGAGYVSNAAAVV